jgi:sec-independent protein translocase protein TatA
MSLFLLGLPSGGEWLLIIAVVLLLFGASAIPKLARSLGRAQGEFQKARKEFQKDVEAGRKEAGGDEESDEKGDEEGDEKEEADRAGVRGDGGRADGEPHVPRAP